METSTIPSPFPPSFQFRLLSIARSQLNVSEDPKGSNRGPQVEKYLASVGLGGGYPWCMAFVYWCVNQACTETKNRNPLKKTGGVLDQWISTAVDYKTKTPAPGDIFIMRFEHGTGHTGFVERVDGNKVVTIEGNTNDDGSREGYEVARRTRPQSFITGYIRLKPKP
jgi:hypothetical protein